MPTKSDNFSVGETSASMDLSLKDTLNTLLAKMDQMDQRLQEYKDQADANCRNLATWLNRLETNQKRTSYHIEDNEAQANNRSPQHRQAQPTHTEDPDAQYIKSVKVDAPFFNERLDPRAYTDWQLAMNHYFHWCDIFESRKF